MRTTPAWYGSLRWHGYEDSDDPESDALLNAFNAYNAGDYEYALATFAALAEADTDLSQALAPYMRICRRVIAIPALAHEQAYLARWRRWWSLPWYVRMLMPVTGYRLRCKYCGRLIRYIDPNEGTAVVGRNVCPECGRGYPVPDSRWDSASGQAFIYARRCVRDKAFYEDYEEQYGRPGVRKRR